MCGRLACALLPEDICSACCYKNNGSIPYLKPQWKMLPNSGQIYKPSFNICPKEVAPVLTAGEHFDSQNRIVAPMVFGLVPSWSKTDNCRNYSTVNCRIETMKTSKLYGALVSKGQRCAVICNGFFEWQTEKGGKQPYFIHREQSPNIKANDPSTWCFKFSEETGYNGFKPLKIAALFERCEGKITIFSFTIITKKASSEMSWLHHRMPLMIETEEQLDAWLNYKNLDIDQALSCFSSSEKVFWYPVSVAVNKPNNKEIICVKESEKKSSNCEKDLSGSAALLKNWLVKGLKREADKVLEENENKKKKDKNSPLD